MFGINTKPFAFVCVLLLCFTAYLVPNKDVSGTQNTLKEITGLQKMVEKIKALPDSTFLNGVDARAYFVNEIMEIKKMCEDGKFGPALKAYNHEVLSKFDGYNNDDLITDATVQSDLLLLTEEVYNEINTAVGILSSYYPQIVSFAVNVNSAQPYNDAQRVVSWSVNWGGSTDGECTLWWNSTWNKTTPTNWPNSQSFGYAGSYSYTITNLPTGNFTHIKVRAFDYDYGGIGTKQSMFVNTEVYDKRIALIICGWGKNQEGIYSFWNDANYTYWTLRTKSFTNIYFLYCNGTHIGTTNYYGTIINGKTTRNSINSICDTINQSSTSFSLVYVAIITHGDYYSGDSYFKLTTDENRTVSNPDEIIYASEFGNTTGIFLGKIINYKRMVVMSCACSSGGFIEPLRGYLPIGQRDKRIVITSTFYNYDSAYYTQDYQYSAFYYFFMSAFNGTGVYLNGTVKLNESTYIPITSEAGDDRDTVCSVVEAYNWSYPLVYYYAAFDPAEGREVCNYNDLHNRSETTSVNLIYTPPSIDSRTLPLNETKCPTSSGTGYWAYLGLGSKGLGITICGNPYPINLLRSDT